MNIELHIEKVQSLLDQMDLKEIVLLRLGAVMH